MPATLSRNLELLIGARDKLSGPLRKMRAGFQRFKAIAGTAVKAVAAAFVAATAAVTAFGAASLIAFGSFETVMRNVFTLLDVSMEKFEALGDSILLMTQSVPQSPEQLGSAIYDIFSAGISATSDALLVLEQSALAATAGVTTTKDAAGAALSIMNAFGKSTEDIPGIFDALFQTVNKGVVTFAELGPAAARTASAFKGAGSSIEQMLGALAFLTKTVGNANESSTKLRAIMRSLTKAAPEFKKQMGTAVFDTVGNFRKLEDIVKDINKSLAGLTRQEQLAKLRKLVPEDEALGALLAMTSNYELLNETMGEVADSHGAMGDAAEKQMDSWENQLRFLNNAFTVIRTSIGELLAAVIGPELGKFTKWLQGIAETLVKNKAAMKAFASTIIPVIKAVGASLVDVLKTSFETAWGFIKEFFKQLQESPRPLLVVLGGLFLEIPKLLWTALQQAFEVVKAVSQIIFTPFQGALLWVGDQIRFWFQDKLRQPFVEFLNWAIEKSNKVREFFGKEPWELFPVKTEVEKAITYEEAWKDTFSVLKERFADLGTAGRDALVNTVNAATASLKELAGTLKGELITPDLQAKLDRVKETLAAIPKTLQAGYEAASKAATKAATEAEAALKRVQAARGKAGAAGAAGAAGEGGKGVAGEADTFGEMFGKAFGAALGFAGGNAVASLIGMLFEAINSGDVSGFVNNLVDGALNFIDGLIQGIPDFIVTLVKRAPDFIIGLVLAIPQLIAALIAAIPDVLRALGSGIIKLLTAAGKSLALAFLVLVEKLIGGLLRFLGIELRDDIERLQGEVEALYSSAVSPRGPGDQTAGGTQGAARDFSRTAAVIPGEAPVVIYNLEFKQPFVMSDQQSMDQLARLLAEADYRQARRSRGTTGSAGS